MLGCFLVVAALAIDFRDLVGEVEPAEFGKPAFRVLVHPRSFFLMRF